MNNHIKNSLIQNICLNKTTRQYHKQYAKQSTDLRMTLTGSLDLQCQNEQTGSSKSSMILMQETKERLFMTVLQLCTRKTTAIFGEAGQR